MMKYIVLFVLGTNILYPMCLNNNEIHVLEILKPRTMMMLSKKEGELNRAINKYKKVLKSKREMMLKLDQNITRIEYVMKENQALRKKILIYWDGVKKTNSMVKSF